MNRQIKAARPRRDLHLRAGPRRSRDGRQRISRGHLFRGLPRDHVRRGGPSPALSPFQLSGRDPQPRRAGDAGRFTRVASSATRWCTRSARRSTHPKHWSSVSSAMVRLRRGLWPRRGTPTSSWTRSATAPSCRSCTSTATRSPTPLSLRASRADELRSLLEGYGYQVHEVEGSDPVKVHQQMAATLDAVLDEIASIQQRARAGRSRRGRAGR